MSAAEVLRLVITALDDADVPYMLVGSFASTLHGAPRTTQDIDLVIDPTSASLARFVASLNPSSVYVGPSPQAALVRREQFNVIDVFTGWKVDLIVRKDRDFSRAEFARRIEAELLGITVWVATAEDTVLSKLEWAAMSGSDRQLGDASAVLAVVGQAMDRAYMDHWAANLGIAGLLDKARRG
ncbi:MAG: hypothetical protein M3066_00050 [Actinomycetota bacterium]|nr:hypothetical protein [Actinomycetota bacterium]